MYENSFNASSILLPLTHAAIIALYCTLEGFRMYLQTLIYMYVDMSVIRCDFEMIIMMIIITIMRVIFNAIRYKYYTDRQEDI